MHDSRCETHESSKDNSDIGCFHESIDKMMSTQFTSSNKSQMP